MTSAVTPSTRTTSTPSRNCTVAAYRARTSARARARNADGGAWSQPSTLCMCWARALRKPAPSPVSGEDEVVDEVAVTVVHEVAHHFGIDEETLHRLGWG